MPEWRGKIAALVEIVGHGAEQDGKSQKEGLIEENTLAAPPRDGDQDESQRRPSRHDPVRVDFETHQGGHRQHAKKTRESRRADPPVALQEIVWAPVGAGVAGVFMETHPKPDEALCDGPNSWPLGMMRELLETLAELDRTVKKKGFAEMKVKG